MLVQTTNMPISIPKVTALFNRHQAAGGVEWTAEQTVDEVIGSVLNGDSEAFEILVRRFSPRVFNIIGSFFRRREIIDDIAQEVFARCYFSLRTYTLGRSFEAWVAKIAVNACYNYLRAERRHTEKRQLADAESEHDWYELQMLEAARQRHLSEERRREAIDTAERLLMKLEPEDRIILVLLDRDGYSIAEIAVMLGWGESKVKTRAFRARRVLRSTMQRLLLTAENQRGRHHQSK
jgi:RNA polymerase sigma-70 factor, ECF subfamily